MKTYNLSIVGLTRQLPIVRLSDNLSIASFVLLGDTELAQLGAQALAEKITLPFDFFLTAEAKGIPLVQCIAQEFNHPKFYVARKTVKAYMDQPLTTEVSSITTQAVQTLVLDGRDVLELKGKRVVLIDDVISTGDSLAALKNLAEDAGAVVIDQIALLAEGPASERTDIKFLEKLPLFK